MSEAPDFDALDGSFAERASSIEERLRSSKASKRERRKQPEAERTDGPKLFLIRHAYAKVGERDPELGMHLSPIGERQAEALARRLASWQIDALLCSDMYRAHETARAVHAFHPGVPLIVDRTFREVSEGKIEAFKRGDPAQADLPARLAAAWEKLVSLPYRVAVLIGHNGLIKYLVGRAIRYESSLKPHFSSAHTGITALQARSGGKAKLMFFNDTRHLTPELVAKKVPWLEDVETGRWHFGDGAESDEDEEADPGDDPAVLRRETGE